MTEMDKAKAVAVRKDLVEMVEKVADLHGLEGHVGRATYDPRLGTYTPQVWFSEPGYEQRQFEEDAVRVGLEPSDFGRVFLYHDVEYRIDQIKPQSPKFPVIVTRLDDQTKRKFTLDAVFSALGR